MLTGKKILIGVTGSIAAYKSAYLVRELIRLGADVKVVMTSSAELFISPLTLSTLSKNPVITSFIKDDPENQRTGEWENHVELGMWADLFVIAPASANSIAKMANGICDNFLMAVYLSAKCPVWLAPAMDLDMFKHFSTQQNLQLLTQKNVCIIEPDSGELASGLEGKGRMKEPQEIAAQIFEYFSPSSVLKNKKVLITGGPTYEAIDPVRFIGNHSSGKTGIFLADAFAEKGANVVLITGPTRYKVKNPNIKTIHITSADEMFSAVQKEWNNSSIGVFSAAVADYKPKNAASEKIKKSSDTLDLKLIKNPDVLQWAGDNKSENQFLVGFALETNNEIENGFEKLKKKHLNMIVLNSLKDEGAGFGVDTNKISILFSNNKITNFELDEKVKLMKKLVEEIEKQVS